MNRKTIKIHVFWHDEGIDACRSSSKPLLISSVGTDAAGVALLDHWQSLGLSTRGISKLQNLPTPTVVYCFHSGKPLIADRASMASQCQCSMSVLYKASLMDADGSVAAGVAAVASLELGFSTAQIHRFRRELCAAPLVILDGNLPANVIEVPYHSIPSRDVHALVFRCQRHCWDPQRIRKLRQV